MSKNFLIISKEVAWKELGYLLVILGKHNVLKEKSEDRRRRFEATLTHDFSLFEILATALPDLKKKKKKKTKRI